MGGSRGLSPVTLSFLRVDLKPTVRSMPVATVFVFVLVPTFMLTSMQGCGKSTTTTTTPDCTSAYYDLGCYSEKPFIDCCSKCPTIGGGSLSTCQWNVSNGDLIIKGDGFGEPTAECFQACQVLGHSTLKDPHEFCKGMSIEKTVSKCKLALQDLQKAQPHMKWCNNSLASSPPSSGTQSAQNSDSELHSHKQIFAERRSMLTQDNTDVCKRAYYNSGCQIEEPFTQCCRNCATSGGDSGSTCHWEARNGDDKVQGDGFAEPTTACFKACQYFGDTSKHPDPHEFCKGGSVEKEKEVSDCSVALQDLRNAQPKMQWCPKSLLAKADDLGAGPKQQKVMV